MNLIKTKYSLILFILLNITACSSKTDLLPEDFFGLKLDKKLTGSEAKQFVDNLHFNSVAQDKNEIGFYSSKVGSAMIYITYYGSDKLSYSEYEKMINKISPENSVFTNPEFVNINSKIIYKCYGMDQNHFVFAEKGELFWISVDTHLGEKFIKAYLDYIK